MRSPIARRGAGIVRLLRLVLKPLMQEEASDTDTDTVVILTHYMRAQGHVLEERIRFLFIFQILMRELGY